MQLKIQKTIPNQNEGVPGEMRVVTSRGGAFLYVRADNQWFSLILKPSHGRATVDRQIRGDLQKNIRFVSEREGGTAGTYGGDNADTNLDGGNIMRPGGKLRKSALDDNPL